MRSTLVGLVVNLCLALTKCTAGSLVTHLLSDLHAVVKGELSVREGHHIAHQVENEILKALPEVSEVLVYIEPEEDWLPRIQLQVIVEQIKGWPLHGVAT